MQPAVPVSNMELALDSVTLMPPARVVADPFTVQPPAPAKEGCQWELPQLWPRHSRKNCGHPTAGATAAAGSGGGGGGGKGPHRIKKKSLEKLKKKALKKF